MILRGLGNIDVSDDSVTMGDAGDSDSLSDLWSTSNTNDANALDAAQNTLDSRGQSTSLASSSSSFDWSGLLNTGVSALGKLFGKSSPAPATSSAAQLAAASAAAQASRTQTYLVVGGLAVAGVVGVLLLRKKRSA